MITLEARWGCSIERNSDATKKNNGLTSFAHPIVRRLHPRNLSVPARCRSTLAVGDLLEHGLAKNSVLVVSQKAVCVGESKLVEPGCERRSIPRERDEQERVNFSWFQRGTRSHSR